MAEEVTRELTVVAAVSGKIVATGISYEEYLARYAANFCEWVGGTVVQMTPISGRHDELTYYLRTLFESYLALRPIGTVRSQPFVMRISDAELAREPDIQVILKTNSGDLTDTAMIGPADICLEVVSTESTGRDYGEKFAEYERVGVREYWIIDPLREECRFHRLDEDGHYRLYSVDAQGNYRTPLLPDLAVHVPTLWERNLPHPGATFQTVQAMLSDRK